MIRRAAERALGQGMRTRACLECLAAVRERVEVPLVPMTYSSLLEAYGWERFAEDARAAGASSMIVADLPAGDRPDLRRIQLVAPTSTDERLRLAARETDGWLYLVSVTGTTGTRTEVSSALGGLAARARAVAGSIPLYAGFGISTPSRPQRRVADGRDHRRLESGRGRRARPCAPRRVRRLAPCCARRLISERSMRARTDA